AGLAASAFAHQAHARVGAPEQPAGGPFRVIIDTDPGVDDALALLLAMRSPELKIEAITPVAGNVPLELTLPNALRMVEIAGRTDIPVAAGAKAPLMRRLGSAAYGHGEHGVGGAVLTAQKLESGQNPVSQAAAKIARNAIAHNRQQGFAVHPHMHDSLAVAAFLDPSLLKFEDYYVDVETAGELTAGETVGYSPIAGDLRRNPAAQKQATLSMPIR